MITEEAAREGLTVFGVDELGLDSLDRRILEILCVRFAGRPVGLSTLAVSVGEEPETVEDVYEPFLLQAGLIMRTPRGRLAAAERLRASRPRDPGPVVELAVGGRPRSIGGDVVAWGPPGRRGARCPVRRERPTRTVARRSPDRATKVMRRIIP